MRADLSTIFGGFATFIVFILAISILQLFILYNQNNLFEITNKKASYLYERSLELINIINNETSNGTIIIKNIGYISLDLKCFKIYVNNKPTNFTYSINEIYNDKLLNPGENATLYVSLNTGWNIVDIVSCRGNKFETLIYET